jgi:transposase
MAPPGLPGRAPEDPAARKFTEDARHGTGGDSVIKLGDLMTILDLHRQGLTVSAIARQLGIDHKTIRKYIARGLEAPAYGPRKPRPRVIDPFARYLRERAITYPGLSERRLFRELRELGYQVATRR